MNWEIVCPDGLVRHFPYNNYDDAVFDAAVFDRRGCRHLDDGGVNGDERWYPPCVGAPHWVQASALAMLRPAKP